ncbi:transglutaminase-like cysteine peptidase [Motilimonas cestriensis]|uniref:Transglutaminase-like cysteine peptidase n=2 Tax=Motilimonas cestriensis TaxID=2742685 RepID=A0ABS8WBH9_9GAMM|nr:transglutaminase-like cysteine peptidase [Motilimonas cestriensis]
MLIVSVVFIAAASPAININQYFTPTLFQEVKNNHGNRAEYRVKAWQRLIEDNQDRTELEKLKLVNDFFNKHIEFIDDIKHWHREDYWATPLETLATEGGDCEDFSIAKYFTLNALGISEDKIRMMYVKALEYNQAHMVVIYIPSPGEYPLVLDNINRDIVTANQRRDLKPVYSFNGQGLWVAKAQGLGNKVKQRKGFAPWVKLIKRIEQGQ